MMIIYIHIYIHTQQQLYKKNIIIIIIRRRNGSWEFISNWVKSSLLCVGMVMTAIVIYTTLTDGLPFRKELLTPWMAATLVDFYIHILAIAAWVVYKESSWISAIVWVVLLVCLGSITTCAYIVLQFLKLSPQESLEDPIYYVLLRREKQDGRELKRSSSVVIARVLFGVLGFLMVGTLLYTIITDGSPFRSVLLTPWLSATLIDFYVNVVALSVWVAYKESSWISASLWIILLICFGSVTTCAYIVLQLFHLSSHDPVYLVLFSSSNRKRVFNVSKRRSGLAERKQLPFGYISTWKFFS